VWIVAPFLLTLVLFGGLALLVQGILARWIDHLGWSSTIASVALVVGWVAYVALATLVLLPLVGLLSGPFLESLSEEVEARVTGRPAPPWSFRRFGRDLALSLGHALRRIAGYVLVLVVLFVLSLVPVLGVLVSLSGGLYLAARCAAWDAFDTVLARRGWSYAQKQDFLAKHRATSLGLGAATVVVMAFPVLGAVAVSLAAVGATLFVVEGEAERR
jgi:CysZ protein